MNFQLSFLPHHPAFSVLQIIYILTIALSTVILFFEHKPCRVSCQQFFNDRMISTNIRKLIADKLKYRRKLQETHIGRNPYKATIVTS